MRRFGGSTVANLMDRLGVDEDMPIEHDLITRSIENSQVKVEGYNFDVRKHLLEYDDVVNQQRQLIYDQRRLILTSATLKDTILDMVAEEVHAAVAWHTQGEPAEWDLSGLLTALRSVMPLPPTSHAKWRGMDAEQIEHEFLDLSLKLYEEKEEQLGHELMRQLERLLMLRVVDSLWVKHLTALDELREGIGLRAFGQRNPLVEYKREAFDKFEDLKAAIAHDVARRIYFVTVVREPAQRQVRAVRPGVQGRRAAPSRSGSGTRVGRNDPCPCGSGRKYKNCCMRKDTAETPGGKASEGQAVQAKRRSTSGRRRKKARKKRR
jgi:preprotein translocase subunit SecA